MEDNKKAKKKKKKIQFEYSLSNLFFTSNKYFKNKDVVTQLNEKLLKY